MHVTCLAHIEQTDAKHDDDDDGVLRLNLLVIEPINF